MGARKTKPLEPAGVELMKPAIREGNKLINTVYNQIVRIKQKKPIEPDPGHPTWNTAFYKQLDAIDNSQQATLESACGEAQAIITTEGIASVTADDIEKATPGSKIRSCIILWAVYTFILNMFQDYLGGTRDLIIGLGDRNELEIFWKNHVSVLLQLLNDPDGNEKKIYRKLQATTNSTVIANTPLDKKQQTILNLFKELGVAAEPTEMDAQNCYSALSAAIRKCELFPNVGTTIGKLDEYAGYKERYRAKQMAKTQ